ncbi:LINE-1 retrotransposable element ORF2 protein [Holothuria leucospilota]|uniref:LINE-1 retrotransposable element ORF2 protein n=1 Tax=Holothuria leucospilota TaxID=206669 RepID=A0A9Q1C2I5_HOLLE|nr:LINE-1 retrotransposable element ORF2 protein [Holothuria leucospilota]
MINFISFCTFNARGLSDHKNRGKVFTWLHNQNLSITFIQEAHCIEASLSIWRNTRGGKALFSCGAVRSAGCVILFKPSLNFTLVKYIADCKGRHIFADIDIDDFIYTIFNVYAPNTDDPSFYNDVYTQLTSNL